MLALGDRAYAKFCETGRVFDERFAALGATRVAERIECDLDYEAPAGTWIDATLGTLQAELGEPEAGAVIHVDFARPAAGSCRLEPRTAIRGGDDRTRPPVGQPVTSDTWHVELSLAGAGIEYEPGDSLGLRAGE